MLFDFYKNGINIGGWLSQYNCLPVPPITEEEMKQHFDTYITQKNIDQIASWGMDHIRLPVDYRILLEESEKCNIKRDAFKYIDYCVAWCQKSGLNIVLDLHDMEGNVYGAMEEPMPLLKEEVLKKRFIFLWKEIARHFKNVNSPKIMFELLNEVSDGSGYLWNELCKQTIEAIREIDQERYILVGSNEQNSAFRLKELDLFADKNIFYNFHFYDPQVFTHQKAHFSEEMVMFNQEVHYPGEIKGFMEFISKNRRFLSKYSKVCMENRVDKDRMRHLIKDALDFVKYSGKELYCGELGVIDSASPEDAARWLRDIIDILEENKIGHAIWNYKEMDFGFVNLKNEIVSEYILQTLFKQ